jgi:GTP-binding protein
MKFNNIKFTNSVAHEWQLPKDNTPEIVFVGRSNAGKSSVINKLSNNKIAKTSKAPGRTRLLNYFLVNDSFYLVDLPGVGYAKVAKSIQKSWQESVATFFASKRPIKGVVHIMDIRNIFTKHDIELAKFFNSWPNLIVLNKSDKLSNNGITKQLSFAKQEASKLDLNCEFTVNSNLKGKGLDKIAHKIDLWLNE